MYVNKLFVKQPNSIVAEPNEGSNMMARKINPTTSRNVPGSGGKQPSSLAAKIRSIFGR